MTEKPAAIESITENQAFSQATRIVQVFRKKKERIGSVTLLLRCIGSTAVWRIQASLGWCLNCSVLGIVTILTANYSVKQSQFTKLTSELLR